MVALLRGCDSVFGEFLQKSHCRKRNHAYLLPPDRNTLGIGDRVGRLQVIVIGFFVPEMMRSLTETSQFGSARCKLQNRGLAGEGS